MGRTVDTGSGGQRGVLRGAALLLAAAGALASCGGSDPAPSTEAVTTTAAATTTSTTTTTEPAPTTIASTTSTTSTSTTSTTTTTEPGPTTTGPADACQAYVGQLSEVLGAAAEQLEAGVAVTTQLIEGTLSETDGAAELAAISTAFGELIDRLFELGEPPEEAVAALALIGESLELFQSAYDLQAQAAAVGDGALIDAATVDIDAGAALLSQVPGAFPDCSAPAGGGAGPTELATPDEFDLTVFFRTAESLFGATDSVYAGTPPEVLTASAQASCRVLLDGGAVRSAIEGAIAASPVAGQPFGAPEQQYVLFVVTRGASLWCPTIVTDEEAFTEEVISTIVDVFFES